MTAWSNDCGWSQLSSNEQANLLAGKTSMHMTKPVDGVSHIDQWGFSQNDLLMGAVANFYDESNYNNAGGVADIVLADGEVVTNNPVVYDVIPRTGNPFGNIYQPFSYSSRVQADADGFNIQINYLSSPGLIKHVFNDVCFGNVDQKVIIRFLSTVTDNPDLPTVEQVFGKVIRKALWRRIFGEDLTRTNQPNSVEKIQNLKKALANLKN